MHCEKAEMLLAPMVFGELDASSPEGAELSAHLAGCKACSELLNDMRVSAGLLREGVQAGEAPALSAERRAVLLNQAAELQARSIAPATRPAKRPVRGMVIAGVAAAAGLAIVAGLMLPAVSGAKKCEFAPKCDAKPTTAPAGATWAWGDHEKSAAAPGENPKSGGFIYELSERDKPAKGYSGGAVQPKSVPAEPIYRSRLRGDEELADLKKREELRGAISDFTDISGKTQPSTHNTKDKLDFGQRTAGGGQGKKLRGDPETSARDLSREWIAGANEENDGRRAKNPSQVAQQGQLPKPIVERPATPLPPPVAKGPQQPLPEKVAERPGPASDPSNSAARGLEYADKQLADVFKRETNHADGDKGPADAPVVAGLPGKDSDEKNSISDVPLGSTGVVGSTRTEDEKKRTSESGKPSPGEPMPLHGVLYAEMERTRNDSSGRHEVKALEHQLSPREIATRNMINGNTAVDPRSKTIAEAPRPNSAFFVLTPEQAEAMDGRNQQQNQQQQQVQPQVSQSGQDQGRNGEQEKEAQAPTNAVFKVVPVNPFVMTVQDRLSTFALDVDTASYSICRRYIRSGQLPPIGAVRMEEFVNAFDYNYPRKSEGVFSVISEAAPAPFGQDLVLLKVGVRARVVGRESRKPANLVFVVDASGSMDQPDRMPLVKYALEELVGQLSPNDKVSLVAYGTKPRLMLEAAGAGDKAAINAALEKMQCEGSTNLADGLTLGYKLAAQNLVPGGINRVILCSDGAANIGATTAEAMLAQVRGYRDKGVTCTSVGFGSGTYNDALLEKLADSGDGSYVFVDSKREARRVFVEEMSATLQTVAKDAKIQVEFDPRRVRRYRLVGYENRDIADDKFRDDTVDAGAVGSGQSSTALYELELQGAPEGDLGTVYVRYRNIETSKVEEISHRLETASVRARTPESDPRFFLAACAAEFAELLRESEHAAGGSFDHLRAVLEKVAMQPSMRSDPRVQELLQLVRAAKGLPRAN